MTPGDRKIVIVASSNGLAYRIDAVGPAGPTPLAYAAIGMGDGEDVYAMAGAARLLKAARLVRGHLRAARTPATIEALEMALDEAIAGATPPEVA